MLRGSKRLGRQMAVVRHDLEQMCTGKWAWHLKNFASGKPPPATITTLLIIYTNTCFYTTHPPTVLATLLTNKITTASPTHAFLYFSYSIIFPHTLLLHHIISLYIYILHNILIQLLSNVHSNYYIII